MKTAYDLGATQPGSTPVYYSVDGNKNLRRHDPDAPSKLEPEPKPQQTIPKMVIDPYFEELQKSIDESMDDAERCVQYGVPVLPEDERHKKRIFFGAMLANENPEVMEAHAIETYDKYHLIALVESNSTHSGEARKMNYESGSMKARILEEGQMFGPSTKVVLDYWLEDPPHIYEMDREIEQRNAIWKIWVAQGMTERDIGIMADLDEILSRDFLNALQVCDFPKLRYDPGKRPSCQTPKMVLSTIQFDGSPLCVKKNEWFHPDLILGSCITGVGDPSGRVNPRRERSPQGSNAKTVGHRTREWGRYDYNEYPQDVIDNNRFPLWDGRDIRENPGFSEDLVNFVEKERKGHGRTAAFGTAYHLHNWFQDTESLRHKFLTYGHPDSHAKEIPLSSFTDGDVNMMVRCVRGLGNDIKIKTKGDPNRYNYYENNAIVLSGEQHKDVSYSLSGNRPIYFSNATYVLERHALLKEMVRADEEKHGTIYNENSIREFKKKVP